MEYKHKIVQGLAALVEMYGGKASDPMMKAVWYGIRGQVPNILQSLDDNEEAIAEMEAKLREVVGTGEADEIKGDLIALFYDRPPQQRNKDSKDGSITIRISADHRLAALFPSEDKAE